MLYGGIYRGLVYGLLRGDTRSLDYSALGFRAYWILTVFGLGFRVWGLEVRVKV